MGKGFNQSKRRYLRSDDEGAIEVLEQCGELGLVVQISLDGCNTWHILELGRIANAGVDLDIARMTVDERLQSGASDESTGTNYDNSLLGRWRRDSDGSHLVCVGIG